MTRKDFILIAGIIKELTGITDIQRKQIALLFAADLAPTNAQFKRDLFIAAATSQCALSARKVSNV